MIYHHQTKVNFLASVKSYSFQIGVNDDGLSVTITEDNIQNLTDALKNAA
jgi:hypothetical protein